MALLGMVAVRARAASEKEEGHVRLAEYLEVDVDGRRCFVNRDDFRLVSGLAAHVRGTEPKHWNELEEDCFIVQITVMRKWNRRKVSPIQEKNGGGRKHLGTKVRGPNRPLL